MALSIEARCSTCGAAVHDEPLVVSHGDLWFHLGCAPSCALCGRMLQPADAGWRCAAEVVFAPWCWSLRPTRFVCADCLGRAATDPPAPLD